VLAYCGQRIRVDWSSAHPASTAAFPANGLKLHLLNVPSTDQAQVGMQIDSVDRFGHSCLDDSVASPIGVLLSCDPSDAPIWWDFSKRTWRERTPRPHYGVVTLQGDSQGKLLGFNYIAAADAHYTPEGFPFQGNCTAEPGTGPYHDQCYVRFKRGRMAVSYTYLATSLRSWREVDMLVRSTLDGQPATERCAFSLAAQ